MPCKYCVQKQMCVLKPYFALRCNSLLHEILKSELKEATEVDRHIFVPTSPPPTLYCYVLSL